MKRLLSVAWRQHSGHQVAIVELDRDYNRADLYHAFTKGRVEIDGKMEQVVDVLSQKVAKQLRGMRIGLALKPRPRLSPKTVGQAVHMAMRMQ